MSNFFEFLKADYILALSTSLSIFFLTVYLVVKRWIGFFVSFCMLLLSLGAGVSVRNYNLIETYLIAYKQENPTINETDNPFKKQIAQAVEDIKNELNIEKENITLLVNQVEEMFSQVDKQKQKLEDFIEETKERFKSEEEMRSKKI